MSTVVTAVSAPSCTEGAAVLMEEAEGAARCGAKSESPRWMSAFANILLSITSWMESSGQPKVELVLLTSLSGSNFLLSMTPPPQHTMA